MTGLNLYYIFYLKIYLVITNRMGTFYLFSIYRMGWDHILNTHSWWDTWYRIYKTVIGTINLNTTKLKGHSMLFHNVTLFDILWLENRYVGDCRKIRWKMKHFPCIKTVRGVIEGFVFNLKPVVWKIINPLHFLSLIQN